MITNPVGNQSSFHQVSIERQKEDNLEARQVLEREAPLENKSATKNETIAKIVNPNTNQ